ncbi:hypothetical protein ACVU7I_07900 [Patulibacter sp. S7RM1-6]
MGLLRRRVVPDVAVPTGLEAPRHALLRPLGFDLQTRTSRSRMTAEVEPFGAPARRVTLRSGTRGTGFGALVPGAPCPALVDDEDPRVVLLVEPTGGYPVPVPTAEQQRTWPARDERTRRLRALYPAPSPRDLAGLSTARDRPFAGLLDRLRLLTTLEAEEVLRRVAAAGPSWREAADRFDVAEPSGLSALAEVADALSHLTRVAGRPETDEDPLIRIADAMRRRHRVDGVPDDPGTPDRDDLRLVLAPLVAVCGPVAR